MYAKPSALLIKLNDLLQIQVHKDVKNFIFSHSEQLKQDIANVNPSYITNLIVNHYYCAIHKLADDHHLVINLTSSVEALQLALKKFECLDKDNEKFRLFINCLKHKIKNPTEPYIYQSNDGNNSSTPNNIGISTVLTFDDENNLVTNNKGYVTTSKESNRRYISTRHNPPSKRRKISHSASTSSCSNDISLPQTNALDLVEEYEKNNFPKTNHIFNSTVSNDQLYTSSNDEFDDEVSTITRRIELNKNLRNSLSGNDINSLHNTNNQTNNISSGSDTDTLNQSLIEQIDLYAKEKFGSGKVSVANSPFFNFNNLLDLDANLKTPDLNDLINDDKSNDQDINEYFPNRSP